MTKGQLLGQGNTAEIFEYDDNKILKLYFEGISTSVCEQELRISIDSLETVRRLMKLYIWMEEMVRYMKE